MHVPLPPGPTALTPAAARAAVGVAGPMTVWADRATDLEEMP